LFPLFSKGLSVHIPPFIASRPGTKHIAGWF